MIFGMEITYFLVLGLALFSSLNGSIYYTYLWQLKEYRLDRILVAMNQKSFREKIFSRFLVGKWVFFLVGLLAWWFSLTSFSNVLGLILIGYGFEILELFWRGLKKQIYRPDFTFKAILVICTEVFAFLLFVALLWIFKTPPDWALFWTFFATLFVADIDSSIIFSINPLTKFLKKKKIRASKLKMAEQKDLKIIGITGSFGKSSTKEFLNKILSAKFKVLKTPGNINVDIGVSGVILNQLRDEHQIFIVEMGAYKKGEIKRITDIVHPDIGIITAVHKAHLGLFGSEEKVKDAKFELVEGIKEGGLGIFNIDSKGGHDLYERAIKYPIERNSISIMGKSDLRAENIKINIDGLKFTIHGHYFDTKLFGIQNIPNLLLAISAAIACGMGMQEISEVVKKIEPMEKTMKLKKINDQIFIIDDSYNANPIGVKAAIESLNLFNDFNKIMFFPGVLELGKHSFEEHQEIGQMIGEFVDFCFFTNEDFRKPLESGLKKVDRKMEYYFDFNHHKMLKKLNKVINNGKKSVILIESRGAKFVEHYLKNLNEF